MKALVISVVPTLLLACILALTGCSSAPKQTRLVSADQYCHVNQTITAQDGSKVSSITVVKCSDDPAEKYVPARLGLAKNCVATHIPVNRNGRAVQEKIYACQKYDGTYSIIDSASVR